jgi:hypothetical protein
VKRVTLLLTCLAGMARATIQSTYDQHTQTTPLQVRMGSSTTIQVNVLGTVKTTNPDGTTSYDVSIRNPITLASSVYDANTRPLGVDAFIISFSQTFVGAGAWMNTLGRGMTAVGASIKQVPPSGTYTLTLESAVDTNFAVLQLASLSQGLDGTNINVLGANVKPWPYTRWNLTACSACSLTRAVTATAFFSSN